MSANPSMPWLRGSVAGVPLVDANGNFLRVTGEGLAGARTTLAASHLSAADGTVWTQMVVIGNAGKPITLTIPACPDDGGYDLFGMLVTAIEGALTAGNDATFPCTLQDSIDTYTFNASVRAGSNYMEYPPQRANSSYIKEVKLHLIMKS
jgi:hypothetical protein